MRQLLPGAFPLAPVCVCVRAAPVTPHWFLPAALCTGPTGTERLRRSRARRWRAGTEGWWCLTALVCQTLSPTTRLQDRCAGQMQVRVCSSPPASVSNHQVSNDLMFFPVLGFFRNKAFGVCVSGWDWTEGGPPHTQLPVQHGLLQEPLLLHWLEEVAAFVPPSPAALPSITTSICCSTGTESSQWEKKAARSLMNTCPTSALTCTASPLQPAAVYGVRSMSIETFFDLLVSG